jgi:CRISPR-associated protein Cmr3
MSEYLFIEPVDVLYLRGNRLFGEAGDHGEALMPPWPSLAAGAIRSRMLADSGVDLAGFANSKAKPDGPLGDCLGTPYAPGSFRLSRFLLAQKGDNGTVSPFFPLPADAVTLQKRVEYLRPQTLHPAIALGGALPQVPVLRQEKPEKPLSGRWLNRAGIAAYLAGEPLSPEHTTGRDTLWESDPRLGIAMDPASRTAADGRIYTTETVALTKGVGFLTGVQGAKSCLPHGGLLRFGGDGRGARVVPCRMEFPEPPWKRIAVEKRFRVVQATPGVFAGGWQLPGLIEENGALILRAKGFSARLAAAAMNRTEVVSGWDLARHQPKPALRVAPTGSVYWLDNFEGAIEELKRLTETGLWPLMDDPDLARRAEGFNNVLIAAWPRD